MNVIDTIYSFEVVKQFTDEEIYQRLFECWGITNGKIEVWGELDINQQGNWAGVLNVKTQRENREIRYPIELNKNIDDGVFIGPFYAKKLIDGDNKQNWIKCDLELASKSERIKQSNPFLLGVKKGTAFKLLKLRFIDGNEVLATGDDSYIS